MDKWFWRAGWKGRAKEERKDGKWTVFRGKRAPGSKERKNMAEDGEQVCLVSVTVPCGARFALMSRSPSAKGSRARGADVTDRSLFTSLLRFMWNIEISQAAFMFYCSHEYLPHRGFLRNNAAQNGLGVKGKNSERFGVRTSCHSVLLHSRPRTESEMR